MLLRCSINTEFFAHNKSRSTSLFIKGKSRDLRKFLRYLIGIVASMLKHGISVCFGQLVSPSFPSCRDLSGAFPIIFGLHSNDLQSEELSSTLSISSLW